MIILEGPDGSGKTTLAGELQKRGYVYSHMGPPAKGENLFRTYQAAIHDAKPLTVCDRLFHGEAVYGPLMRGESQLTKEQLAYLELEAATRGCIVVWCSADAKTLVERGDPIYQQLHSTDPVLGANHLINAYSLVGHQSKLPRLFYDSSYRALDHHLLAEILGKHEPRSWSHRGVGCPPCRSPNGIVLLGEKFSGSWPQPDHPGWQTHYKHFRPFDHGPSGEYLLRALNRTSFAPGDLYITNAIKQETNANHLRDELTGARRVVCLGEKAERQFRAMQLDRLISRVTWTRIPHPAWWQRFKHHDLIGYVELLEAAMRGEGK